MLYELIDTDNLLWQLPRDSVEGLYVDAMTWEEMAPFWDAYRPWLAARGYKLYQFYYFGSSPVYLPPAHTTAASLPYATRASNDVLADEPLIPNVSLISYLCILRLMLAH